MKGPILSLGLPRLMPDFALKTPAGNRAFIEKPEGASAGWAWSARARSRPGRSGPHRRSPRFTLLFQKTRKKQHNSPN